MEYKTLREKIAAEKTEREARYSEFARLLSEAWEKGREAALAAIPNPMVVTTAEGEVVDVVHDGPCGFAWVNVPGNTSFGRWLKKNNLARPDYPSGLSIWISDYNQSYERKSAHAGAMVHYLTEKGIACRRGSRLD